MELTIKVNLVSLKLESLTDAVEVLDLKYEVRDIVDWLVEVTDRLSEPDEDKVCLLFGVCRDKLFNFVLE